MFYVLYFCDAFDHLFFLLPQQKRYSLQAGPPKKDPKSKGVNSSAIQAFLKKKEIEDKKKGKFIVANNTLESKVICNAICSI